MGDDSLILREDGYIRMNFPVTSLTYHSNLNIILVKTDVGGVHVLDVNSGVILQSSCLSADDDGTLGVEYAPGADRVFVWDSSGVGARTDYNGVLLLHTALQRPLPSSQIENNISVELVLSEAVLLYQCLQSLDANSIEGLADFVKELKASIDIEPVRKGVKAQKWSTVTISLPQSILRLVTISVVQELKGQNRRIPALAIASAVGQRANELVLCSRDEEIRPLMYSEAERKETFKRWPHMDYKWALPARMAQAGFYHQPSPSGDDRAMCFTCLVCLVCWEKSDEPWVEHERHSPNCPFVRGEYTHNVPISVTNATACAVPSPNVTVVSKGNTGDLIAAGTADGKVNIWRFDCGLKLAKFIHLSPYDSIFSGILSMDTNKVWSTSLEKDSSTYGIELTAMAFVGMTSQQEPNPQAQNPESADKDNNTSKAKPALICAVIVTRTNEAQSDQPIKEDSSKALFDSGGSNKSQESIQEMNNQNEAKSNQTTNKMLFLLTYDIHSSTAGSTTTVVHTSNSSGNSKPGGSKKLCAVTRADDANIYDDMYFQYSDDEQISNVINLNASSSKEDNNIWEPTKKIILTKNFKVLPPQVGQLLTPEFQEQAANYQASVIDFVGKISQSKTWKSGNLDSTGTKLTDQPDGAVLHSDAHLHHYLTNMSGPLEISDLKWYDCDEGTEKVKVTTFSGAKIGTHNAVSHSNNDGFDSDPPQEEVVSQGVAVQCLSFPAKLNLPDDATVTHLLPTEDKEQLLVVISSIDPDKVKVVEEIDNDGDVKMEVDDADTLDKTKPDRKAFFILYEIHSKTSIYTLEDNPVIIKELSYDESPVDLCLLPGENDQYLSIASVGVDGCLRLYSLSDFRILSEQRVPKGQFTSVTYCASVDRLSVSTKHGMIYFYALNNGEKDSTGDMDEDEFANLDFDMLQRAPKEEASGAPVILANKPELDMTDLKTLIDLSGSYGTNKTIPYSAVVPGFWCELSPAQRPRSDHQNNRTWRLQNTSSTWDEHVLELTLPYSVSLAHIEFAFTLHSACTANLPIIMVTLLKQNLHGIGYKKDASFVYRSESPITFPVIDTDVSNLENPIHSEEYLQAHNAEILAGPLILSSGLDSTQQSGVLTLTSPRLYRARGRTFLIHIKTLFDPAKDMSKEPTKSEDSKSSSKKYIGCDWLHQISLTVRSSPPYDVPMERQQRIAMLESNGFLNTLCEIVVSKDDIEKRKIALDIIIWVVYVRLQRMRLAKSEKGKNENKSVEMQQLECIKVLEKHIDAMIRICILCGDRSVAKKCIRIIMITSEGEKQLPKPWKSTFEQTLCNSVAACIPYIGAVQSAGALKWFAALVQHAAPASGAQDFVDKLLTLLEKSATTLLSRQREYQHLLRSRFGLYGLPFERTIFAPETPEVGRNGAPVTYASILASDNSGSSAPPPQRHDQQLRELLNWPKEASASSEGKGPAPWWAQSSGAGVFALGLSEATPLHGSCHAASDGTKLESAPLHPRHHAAVVSALPHPLPPDPHQLWSRIKEGIAKQNSQDPDSLEDVESSLMDCDPQEKLDFSEDKLFKEQEQCSIPWAALVTRPPHHTLMVERMHSGARRYIVLDFGHIVRLTDLIIPACSDLVTLCIDIWVMNEESDSVKLAFATDIATKNLVLTDLQPPQLCRYMKITTIGRYGMSAMKCKIPLGWFYGEIDEVANVQASINALNALHQDLSCRFRLATGKLTGLLNPYLNLYNGNACHMMAYINNTTEGDSRVTAAYNECIELQQQLHTCTNILKKLQNQTDEGRSVAEMIEKGGVSPDVLLETASTDKLRVVTENVVDMLLYFYFQVSEEYLAVGRDWCSAVAPLVWECGGASAGALATLVARVCGAARWWGEALADALTDAFASSLAPPTPLDRCLVLVIYMCRKSMFAHRARAGSGAGEGEGEGVAQALSARALALLQSARPQPALTAAILTALAAVLDAVAAANTTNTHSRWDWVSGGCAVTGSAGGGGSASASGAARGAECKVHRRKLHKKLLHQMQELEAARRGIQEQIVDQQRVRMSLKTRMAMLGKRSASKSEGSTEGTYAVRPVSPALSASLASALVQHMLAADSASDADTMMLCAKVVGRLCALSGGANLLDPSGILGLARLAVTLPPWPRHALTTLLQDLVEFENNESTSSPGGEESWGPGASRVIRVTPERGARPFQPKPPRKHKGPTVADLLADSFGLPKTTNANVGKPKLNPPAGPMSPNAVLKDLDVEEQLTQVAESDDSESSEEKLEQYFVESLRKEYKTRVVTDTSTNAEVGKYVYSNMSRCADARFEGAGGGAGGAGEAAARLALLATAAALPIAVRAELHASPSPAGSPAAATQSASSASTPTSAAPAPASASASASSGSGSGATPAAAPPKHHPPLTHTLYDVFRHLALDFQNQMECTLLENVVALWLTLNGSAWGSSGPWTLSSSLATLAVSADTPRIRLASDTVTALLRALCQYESVSLRCWVLSMQALAWVAGLPLQTEGSTQTMGRVILECEHFVPALVKFVNMNVSAEGMVTIPEPYLAGSSIGCGAGGAGALQAVVSRVVCARGAGGALAALRAVAAAWQDDARHAPPDLHATLLRLAYPMLQVLQPRHLYHALPLLHSIAQHSSMWVREAACSGAEGGGGAGGSGGGGGGGETRTPGLLAEMVAGGVGRRAPSRRSVLAQLLAYARRLLQAPLPRAQAGASSSSSSTEQCQTDESKAQHSGTDSTNMEDEKKQQAARTPCLSDTVIAHPQIMQQFYKTLMLCDGLNMRLLNSDNGQRKQTYPGGSEDNASIKEEMFWLVAQIATISAAPAAMVPGLLEFLRREEIVHLSQAMQQLIIRLLDNPEALAAFIDNGGLELAVEKLTAKHQSGPSHNQGLVSYLMNYLKLPPQLINMSTPANKKSQPLVVETANGLINIAPLCTISCGNPTAQAADVLLEGGGSGGGARGACAARRVRAAAWSYHFFSADDASLALTVTLPYAARLHEVQLQPHLTSLATCPGAVGVEAGCGGTVAPLGPPQNTAGMTYIRLVVARPLVCTTVQLRLYKPRDSSNMGLLQLRLLAAPAFASPAHLDHPLTANNWASVVAWCVRAGPRLSGERWGALAAPGAVRALCACVAAGGPAALPAHRALLAAARALPVLHRPLLHALLDMDKHAYAHAFQVSGSSRVNSGLSSICSLIRQLCRWCPESTVPAYLEWVRTAWRDSADPPAPPHLNTLASVLWTLKEKQLMENLEELITDELFESVLEWIKRVPDNSLLKKALDAILCSMCYIRLELFRTLLERFKVPVDVDDSMEGLTDDTKVHGSPCRAGGGGGGAVARLLPGSEVRTVAAAAMSPAAMLVLLNSQLPDAVVAALTEFAEERLAILKEEVQTSSDDARSIDESSMTGKTPADQADIACMVRANYLVEWVRLVSVDQRAKDWAGGAGAAFWSPLLRLLCYPLRNDTTWQVSAQFAELEESTIKMFAELTTCHPQNQKLFATTLHSILESLPSTDPEGISGFTRALILRLVLSSERVSVVIRWTGAGAAAEWEGACGGGGAAPAHPAHGAQAARSLPAHTTVRDLIADFRPHMTTTEEVYKILNNQSSGPSSVLRSASDTAITTVAEAWELSLAAASASKDKRVKDVKNTSLKNQGNKKKQTKNDMPIISLADDIVIIPDIIESTVMVQVEGLEVSVSSSTTLGQLCTSVPRAFGPHLTLVFHLNTGNEKSSRSPNANTSGGSGAVTTAVSSPTGTPTEAGGGSASGALLREFGLCGGLALVAARLPRPHVPPPDPPAAHKQHHDLDWVKLDDPYEVVMPDGELGGGGGNAGGGGSGVGGGAGTGAGEEGACGIPAHALVALGLLLKLPGYAAALLDEGAKAVHLLRLLMGVAHTEDGRSIAVGGGGRGRGGGGGYSLGTLPFRVVSRLLEAAPRRTEAGAALRRTLLHCGAARMVLSCLAVFTHHRPTSADNSQGSNGSTGRPEEKGQLYWAKGTGFGTGSTQQSWNVEQALVRQRTEEEHVTVLLQVLASYMNPGEQWPPDESSQEDESSTEEKENEDQSTDLATEFLDLVAGSSLVPAICSYLRNDSVLDMSRHIPLYVCVLRCARALHALRAPRLVPALRPLPRLLAQMSRTTNSYATKLKMSKKNIFGKMTYSQRFSTSSNSELSEEDEGLAALIADIQATSALMCRAEQELESSAPSTRSLATRDLTYIELMRTMQFETFEMIAECPENGFRFKVPYHFEGTVRAAGERAGGARMKRLAQEAATLATSLPLSYSSSVFVRTDTDRLDVMKVLITGPSDTPYANGCFILDVYFPAEYPSVPMLINLETTGRQSVRFNPNLYNDGKVCLSVLNTWHGRPEEKWNAHTSSFLQVLVSIQSLILVPEPYFNEPGYERSRGTRVGAAASTEYNSNIYQACVRWAMLDQLRNPEPCFKEVIQTHFWIKRNEIMKTVSNWITELEGHHGDERTQRSIHHNAMALKRHYVKLQEELGKLQCPPGLEELDEPFQLPAAPAPTPGAAGVVPPGPLSPLAPPSPLPLDSSNEDIDHDMEKIVSQVLD